MQNHLSLKLVVGSKVLSGGFNLSSNIDDDFSTATEILTNLRDNLSAAPEDPFFDLNKEVTATESLKENSY